MLKAAFAASFRLRLFLLLSLGTEPAVDGPDELKELRDVLGPSTAANLSSEPTALCNPHDSGADGGSSARISWVRSICSGDAEVPSPDTEYGTALDAKESPWLPGLSLLEPSSLAAAELDLMPIILIAADFASCVREGRLECRVWTGLLAGESSRATALQTSCSSARLAMARSAACAL